MYKSKPCSNLKTDQILGLQHRDHIHLDNTASKLLHPISLDNVTTYCCVSRLRHSSFLSRSSFLLGLGSSYLTQALPIEKMKMNCSAAILVLSFFVFELAGWSQSLSLFHLAHCGTTWFYNFLCSHARLGEHFDHGRLPCPLFITFILQLEMRIGIETAIFDLMSTVML